MEKITSEETNKTPKQIVKIFHGDLKQKDCCIFCKMICWICRLHHIDDEENKHPHHVDQKSGNCIRERHKNKPNDDLWELIFNSHHCSGIYLYAKHDTNTDNDKSKNKQQIGNVSKCNPRG